MAIGSYGFKHLPPLERFWANTTVLGPDECWPYLNAPKNRYGRIQVDGKRVYAHRFSLELASGEPIPDGLCALHHCDNKACVNPAHLYVGDAKQNMADAKARDRLNPRCRGITHCVRGHEFTDENTRRWAGKRICITCYRHHYPSKQRKAVAA